MLARGRSAPLLASAAMSVAALAGCGDGDDDGETGASASPQATPTSTFRIKDFVFDPTSATIKAGQKITVPNDDAAPHTLTEQPADGKPSFDTGTLKGRRTGSFTADKPGTYEVYCVIHPFMKGEVKVVS